MRERSGIGIVIGWVLSGALGCGVADRPFDIAQGGDGGPDASIDGSSSGSGGKGGASSGSAGGGGVGVGGEGGTTSGSSGSGGTNGSGGAGGSDGTGGTSVPGDAMTSQDATTHGDASSIDGAREPDARAGNDATIDAARDGAADACPANACGGCGTLAGAPGAACGTCGKYVCSTDKSTVSCADQTNGGCCIGGVVYTSGAVKSDNTCMGCTPATSSTNWSPRTTCGNGNPGCACSGGMPKETNCSDGADNDGDATTDCADTNCDGLLCLAKTQDPAVPSSDDWVSIDEQSNYTTHDGTATLSVYKGGSSGPHPYQAGFAEIKFGGLPQVTAATITKATLRFYYSGPVATMAQILDLDDLTVLCTVNLDVHPTLTAATCDVTMGVQKWYSTALRADRRGFKIQTPGFGDQDVTISALEGPAATAPRLLLDYQTACTGKSCPGL